jgi:hypothetical protein
MANALTLMGSKHPLVPPRREQAKPLDRPLRFLQGLQRALDLHGAPLAMIARSRIHAGIMAWGWELAV